MFLRRAMSQRGGGSESFTLNITSLMDILTIVLIFLIMSFSTEEDEITPPKGVTLPASHAERPAKMTFKVTITDADVQVEGKSVANLVDGEIPDSELNENAHVKGLLAELERQKAQLDSQGQSEANLSGESDAEIVYFEAGRQTPYELIDRLMKTAAAAGFTKFRLAVLRKI